MKKILCFVISLVMLLSMSVTTFAAGKSGSEISVAIDPDTTITIIVPNELMSKIGAVEIDGLINSQVLNNGDVITIYELEDVTIDENIAQPYLFDRVETTRSFGEEYAIQDFFVISAAKGQTTTLSTTFSRTVSSNFSVGDDPYIKAEIGGSVTVEYDVSHEFKGPPEGSKYNSREYRVQFYARRVDWVQRKYNLSDELVGTRSGTAYVPTRYLQYSIDHSI